MNNINTRDTRIKLINFFRNEICKNCNKNSQCNKEFYCDNFLQLFEDIKNDAKINIKRTITTMLGELNVYLSNELINEIIDIRNKSMDEYYQLMQRFEYHKDKYICIAGNLAQLELIKHNQLTGIEMLPFYGKDFKQNIKALFDYLRNDEL